MTISTTATKASAVGTNAAGQQVSFNFPIEESSDLVVFTRVTATEVETTLTETTDYTVDVTGQTVTVIDAVATTSEIHVERQTPATQTLELEIGGSFNAQNIEDALDKLTKLVQENRNNLSGAGYQTLGQSDFAQLVVHDGEVVTHNGEVVYLNN